MKQGIDFLKLFENDVGYLNSIYKKGTLRINSKKAFENSPEKVLLHLKISQKQLQ